MPAASAALDTTKSHGRSRISNGSALLAGVDGRSTWVRRLRDLIALHLSDLGGEDAVSEAERSIVRRIATLTVELERMESVFAIAGEALPDQIDLYQRTANSLRRLLEAVGLERRAHDVTPSLADYLASKRPEMSAHESAEADPAETAAEATDALIGLDKGPLDPSREVAERPLSDHARADGMYADPMPPAQRQPDAPAGDAQAGAACSRESSAAPASFNSGPGDAV